MMDIKAEEEELIIGFPKVCVFTTVHGRIRTTPFL